MKKVGIPQSILTLVCMLVPLVAVAQEKIRVGISAPLTGDAATYGIEMKNAYELAAEHFGQEKYELIFEDDRCGGVSASNAAQKLVGVEKVSYALS